MKTLVILTLALAGIGSAQFNTTVAPPAPLRLNSPPPADDYLDTMRKLQEIRMMQAQRQMQEEQLREATEARQRAAQPDQATAATLPSTMAAAPDSASLQTENELNCRGWKTAPASMRDGYTIGYTQGIGDGLGLTALPEKARADLAKIVLPPSSTFREVRLYLDAFCETPENASLPIVDGFVVFTLKVNGGPPDAIEAMVAGLRKSASDSLKPSHKDDAPHLIRK